MILEMQEGKDDVGVKLAKIAAKDITGGLRILDCSHAFVDCTIVVHSKQWLLIHTWEINCCHCSKKSSVTYAHWIDCCPFCGMRHENPGRMTRNYVIGRNLAMDEHLLKMGLFDEGESQNKA